MSENERLREELEALVYALDFEDLSDSVDLNGAKSALTAKPDVCVYTRELFENEVRLTSACGRVWTWEDVDAGMAIPDKIHQYCSKCGAKIEVRE